MFRLKFDYYARARTPQAGSVAALDKFLIYNGDCTRSLRLINFRLTKHTHNTLTLLPCGDKTDLKQFSLYGNSCKQRECFGRIISDTRLIDVWFVQRERTSTALPDQGWKQYTVNEFIFVSSVGLGTISRAQNFAISSDMLCTLHTVIHSRDKFFAKLITSRSSLKLCPRKRGCTFWFVCWGIVPNCRTCLSRQTHSATKYYYSN